tara:strand:+ start:1346 stop:1693 length:348 start_codon:yes stop_codon:yes gene_type:complete
LIGRQPTQPGSLTQFRTISTYKDNIEHPCPKCRGVGSIHDPDELPDAVEGYRHVPHINCTDCDGSGQLPLNEFLLLYYQYIKECLDKIDRWNKKERRILRALDKLTEEDCRVLQL